MRQYRREPAAMRAALQQVDALGRDGTLSMFHLWATVFRGWLEAVHGQDPAGLTKIQQALRQWEATGAQGGLAYQYLLLAEAHLALGQAETARVTLEHILAQIAAGGPRFLEADLVRLQGEALRALGRPAEAEGCFRRAIAVAREQAAKAWELRAVLSLCRLWQAEGTPDALEAARQQLAELPAWFTEGLDLPDLVEARALVGKLRKTPDG